MELTKHVHATVVLTKEGAGALLLDPGAYTPNTPDLLAAADAVLITHDHPDHVDLDALRAALDARPDLPVHAPAAVRAADERIRLASPGDSFSLAGWDVTVFGGVHAPIHGDLPPMENVAYLVDATVLHPGDAYEVPGVEVPVLLLPTSGPWAKVGEAVDYVRAVRPGRVVQIHDLMLSEVGQQNTTQTIGRLGGVEVEVVPPGSSVTL